MRALCILLLCVLGLAACETSESKLKDVAWGKTVEADHDLLTDRARHILLQRFPKGFDPDRTDEAAGEYWTIWHFKTSMWYRGTTRERAHLKVEDLGEGKVRIGVAVVRQLNDNIDNPHLIDEARWVRTHRDNEMEERIENSIARRYLEGGPSEQWKARHSGSKSNSVRHDLVDRYRDVDLDSSSKLGYEEDGLPSITGRDKFYGDYKEQGWKDKYSGEKKRKKKEQEEKAKEKGD